MTESEDRLSQRQAEALRSLILEDMRWETILLGFAVVAIAGAIMLALSVRMIRTYD